MSLTRNTQRFKLLVSDNIQYQPNNTSYIHSSNTAHNYEMQYAQ